MRISAGMPMNTATNASIVVSGTAHTLYGFAGIGTTVYRKPRPAPGSSGAIQNQASMHRAGTIIAIKKYTDTQIIADLGIVGEITTIVPELTSLLQERANQCSAQRFAAAETN